MTKTITFIWIPAFAFALDVAQYGTATSGLHWRVTHAHHFELPIDTERFRSEMSPLANHKRRPLFFRKHDHASANAIKIATLVIPAKAGIQTLHFPVLVSSQSTMHSSGFPPSRVRGKD